MSDSWIWDDYNTTDTVDSSLDCEEITNHWLFFIFSGYVLPLFSSRVRDYLKETLNRLKTSSIGGQFVTLTEFGFEKIQGIENNEEMKKFIKRMCEEKKIEWNDETLEKIAWLFSGDKDDTHTSIQQTWTKLNKVLASMKSLSSIKP